MRVISLKPLYFYSRTQILLKLIDLLITSIDNSPDKRTHTPWRPSLPPFLLGSYRVDWMIVTNKQKTNSPKRKMKALWLIPLSVTGLVYTVILRLYVFFESLIWGWWNRWSGYSVWCWKSRCSDPWVWCWHRYLPGRHTPEPVADDWREKNEVEGWILDGPDRASGTGCLLYSWVCVLTSHSRRYTDGRRSPVSPRGSSTSTIENKSRPCYTFWTSVVLDMH